MPSQGFAPHRPVAGSQYSPCVQLAAVQRLGAQDAGPASPVAGWQSCPVGQSTPQPVGWHLPPTHACPASQCTSAHDPTQFRDEKSAVGLHTSVAAHGFVAQGFGTQARFAVHACPSGQPKKKQLSWGWHVPSLGAHASPGVPHEGLPKQGAWQAEPP